VHWFLVDRAATSHVRFFTHFSPIVTMRLPSYTGFDKLQIAYVKECHTSAINPGFFVSTQAAHPPAADVVANGVTLPSACALYHISASRQFATHPMLKRAI
jgi:hypothetical protein